MSVTYRVGAPADHLRVLPLIDQEFVFGKGRSISLAQRFPDVYSPANSQNFYLAELGGEIAGFLACKEFALPHGGCAGKGAMIGAVYTRPERRGHGIASKLLDYCADRLSRSGFDFAVLWTAQSDFYKRLGWVCGASGLLGTVEAGATAANSGTRKAGLPIRSADCSKIEQVRRRWNDSFVPRNELEYRHIPLPAEWIELFCENAKEDGYSAYALTGVVNDTRIVYEMTGEPVAFDSLWVDLSSGFSRVLINDVRGSPSECWLTQNVAPHWDAKQLAMWLALSSRGNPERFVNCHVPYFDRI